MRLVDKNYQKTTHVKLLGEERREATSYQYHAHLAWYCVDVLSSPFTHEGKTYTRLYYKNTHYMAEPEKIHLEIEKYFAL